ncbi:dihydroneopterin aldolase [Paenibacillus yanchengensis]|uniref:7,8-dihydroneopterin aldolase n=1 Tax=Paenibacillus yanchengensis TaxID=2035833 RepID=A0ABW4YIC8_9BACL
MDKMYLQGMKFYGYHGVFAEENKLGQQFIVDVILNLDLHTAAETDDLNTTINYAETYDYIQRIAEGEPVKLIEALAGKIASQLLDVYTMVHEVTVKVTKPSPPFKVFFDGVTVELTRSRERV